MTTELIVIVSVAGFIVVMILGAMLSAVLGKAGKGLRRLAGATPVAAGGARDGERVKLRGKVRRGPEGTQRAVVGGGEVVYSELLLVYGPGDKRAQLSRGCDFVVSDGTGEAIVRIDSATVHLEKPALHGEVDGAEMPDWMRALWEQHGLFFEGTPGRRTRIEERVLEPGTEVAVLGRANWTGEPGERRRLVIEADAEVGVVVSDHQRFMD
jgi:hypothetical protein